MLRHARKPRGNRRARPVAGLAAATLCAVAAVPIQAAVSRAATSTANSGSVIESNTAGANPAGSNSVKSGPIKSTTVKSSSLAATSFPSGDRVDLRVLVLTDGSSPVEAIRTELSTEGVPYTAIDLTSATRQQLTAAFLAGTAGAVPEAHFDAVVLPNNAPAQLSAAEISALDAYEITYSVRQVDAYLYPSPAVGMNYPTFAGTLDGMTATATSDGKTKAFPYLSGSVPFENIDPTISESYGYLGTPNPATGTTFDPLLTMTIPGTTTQGVLAGIYATSNRSELINTFAYNANQAQFRALAHGFITWATQGVHFGYDRNYFTVDVDDTFLPDSEWSQVGHCTPGDSICPAGIPDTTPSRMTAADVSYQASWQNANNYKLTMLYNGGGSDDEVTATGSDPLLTAWQANKSAALEWVNHTYSHEFLGCEQNETTIPWSCQTDASGNPIWVPQSDITSQVSQNVAWAKAKGFTTDATELVTGEHSGLATLPQQPVDNPNLGPGLAAQHVAWTGSDASREPNQRLVTGGSTLTVPRHPMNVYYNAATVSDEINEYNWVYTSAANGGSGICENNPTSTCISPLDPVTGYTDYIVPTEARIALSHITANDPRPTYVHQSNLAEDRTLYPALNAILSQYRAEFASTAPIVEQTLAAEGQTLQQQSAWAAAVAAGSVSGYLQSGKVFISAPSGLYVPFPGPTGTQNPGLLGGSLGATAFGSAYAGELSAYKKSPAGGFTLLLPGYSGLL